MKVFALSVLRDFFAVLVVLRGDAFYVCSVIILSLTDEALSLIFVFNNFI